MGSFFPSSSDDSSSHLLFLGPFIDIDLGIPSLKVHFLPKKTNFKIRIRRLLCVVSTMNRTALLHRALSLFRRSSDDALSGADQPEISAASNEKSCLADEADAVSTSTSPSPISQDVMLTILHRARTLFRQSSDDALPEADQAETSIASNTRASQVDEAAAVSTFTSLFPLSISGLGTYDLPILPVFTLALAILAAWIMMDRQQADDLIETKKTKVTDMLEELKKSCLNQESLRKSNKKDQIEAIRLASGVGI